MTAGLLRLAVARAGGTIHTIDVGPGVVRLGRDPSCDVRIPDEGVALEAARLERLDGGPWSLLAVAPGVRFAGAALAAGARAPVVAGAILRIAAVSITFADAPADATATGERTASLARELVRELLAGPGSAPELVIEGGPSLGKRVRLPPPEARVIVGRGGTSTWVVLDEDLSRAHAAFDRGWDGTRVIDLGSKNGTQVGAANAPTEPPGRLLVDGDVVSIGATRIRYHDPAEQYLRQLDARLGAADAAPVAVAPEVTAPTRASGQVPWLAIGAGVIAIGAVAALVWLLSA